MFRQDDLSQFFLGNSGPLKRQNEQRTQCVKDYEKSKRSRQFLKEWKQNRPWLVKSPKQRLETYCFCSVSSSYYYYSFFPCTMHLSTTDLRNYRTEFHETWWSYRYMFLVDPKVFRFVVKGVKAIFLGVQMGWGLL